MVFAGAYALMAQSLSCRDQGGGDLQFCEIRENTIPAGGLLSVDGKVNGGVSVIGSNRSDILVRAMVQARDRSAGSQVVVHTSSGAVSADGPAGAPWSVSYEILVPIKTDLRLTTHNGGVAVSGVRSSIEFHAVNGGVSIRDAGGNVRGETVNGGISLKISDQQWNGQGIDVSTTNGGVSVKVPEHFSGLLDLATVNGGMSVKLPGAQIDPNQRRLSMNVGAGGPPVRVHTQNGGVSLASGL
jgi:DUF4097 and DUF4098 domain-containing protein YvlB